MKAPAWSVPRFARPSVSVSLLLHPSTLDQLERHAGASVESESARGEEIFELDFARSGLPSTVPYVPSWHGKTCLSVSGVSRLNYSPVGVLGQGHGNRRVPESQMPKMMGGAKMQRKAGPASEHATRKSNQRVGRCSPFAFRCSRVLCAGMQGA